MSHSRIPIPTNGLSYHNRPQSPSPTSATIPTDMSAPSPAADTRRKQSKRDETTALPQPTLSPPLSHPMTTQKPLDTPPASIRSHSSDSIPKSTATPVPSSIAAVPTNAPMAADPKRSSVTFPSDSVPTPTSNPNDAPARPRYHSSVSRNTVTLTRSESSSNFAGKLKSLRKKIENELSRKRTGGNAPQTTNKRSSKKAIKGTVAGLRPSPALTVPESMSVADASQLCAAKRTDCVLVVDDEEGLSGIFTAKDLAFRVTAEGLDPRTTLVSQIMTKNPMVTRDTTGATEALQLMVSRGFRHLPVCNEDGDVVGLLDITKVFHEALAKVERGSSATSQLSAALAGVQSELGPGLAANPQAAAMLAYVDALRDRMALPDLNSVLDARVAPPTVTPRTSVRDAARLMKERRTTAVCVMEANAATSAISGQTGSGVIPKIAGIFTSKDIVLRVIAAGLDASRCSVVRVMTPHPDTAPPDMIVQDALKKMHNGHYLNLPVVDADGRLVGIVDVLKLTYATLEQIESMSEDQSNANGGPMWGKFFDALQHTADDDTASAVSHSDRPDTPSRPTHGRGLSSVTSPISEVMPNDSASVADDRSEIARGASSSVAPPSMPVDDGTYIFKFRTPSGRTHRFQARHDSYELLRDIVAGKLASDPFFHPEPKVDGEQVHLPDPNHFSLSYTDDDGDLVTITADGDVADAVRIARGQKTDRVVLLVDGGKVWEDAARDLGGESAVQKLKEVEHEVKGVEDEEDHMKEESADPAKEATWGKKGVVHSHNPPAQELVAGIPKDLVLPAAIGFLGVVIIGVFFASRK